MSRDALALVFAAAALLAGCTQQPVVTLGGPVQVDAGLDDDTAIDEAERERLFRDLAMRECQQDEPVCGADGLTYRNYCQAVANGVQTTPGACAPTF